MRFDSSRAAGGASAGRAGIASRYGMGFSSEIGATPTPAERARRHRKRPGSRSAQAAADDQQRLVRNWNCAYRSHSTPTPKCSKPPVQPAAPRERARVRSRRHDGPWRRDRRALLGNRMRIPGRQPRHVEVEDMSGSNAVARDLRACHRAPASLPLVEEACNAEAHIKGRVVNEHVGAGVPAR